MHHTFSYTSLPSLHDYDVKVPNFLFCAGKTKGNNFLFFSELQYSTTEMLFLMNEPTKKAEIHISTAQDTTGPGF